MLCGCVRARRNIRQKTDDVVKALRNLIPMRVLVQFPFDHDEIIASAQHGDYGLMSIGGAVNVILPSLCSCRVPPAWIDRLPVCSSVMLPSGSILRLAT